jgi:hypothetical protein
MAYQVHSIQEGEKCQWKGSDFGAEGSEQEETEGMEGGQTYAKQKETK